MIPHIDWRRALLAAPLLAVALLAVALLVRDEADASTPRAVLQETPPVAGYDAGVVSGRAARDFVAQSHDGDTVRLSDLRGTPTIINFWATWCTSCLVEMPDLRDIQQEFGADNIHVVAVNTGESSRAAREFLDELDAPAFLVAMDPTLAVADAYGVYGLSTSVFVDAAGVIRGVYTGQMPKELIREWASMASQGAAAPPAPPRIRLAGDVQARERVLRVEERGETLEFESKMLRCDDTYCAGAAIDLIASLPGVATVERHLSDDPPRVLVSFEDYVVPADQLVDQVAAILEEQDDPLYRDREFRIERE